VVTVQMEIPLFLAVVGAVVAESRCISMTTRLSQSSGSWQLVALGATVLSAVAVLTEVTKNKKIEK
jgi:hypothetical protein